MATDSGQLKGVQAVWCGMPKVKGDMHVPERHQGNFDSVKDDEKRTWYGGRCSQNKQREVTLIFSFRCQQVVLKLGAAAHLPSKCLPFRFVSRRL